MALHTGCLIIHYTKDGKDYLRGSQEHFHPLSNENLARIQSGFMVCKTSLIINPFLIRVGNPGCGKTVQAASTVEELQAMSQSSIGAEKLICYFFFESDVPTSTGSTAPFRAFLSQILQIRRQDEALLDQFTYAMSMLSTGQRTATDLEVFELLRLCCQSTEKEMYLLLDAVDECTDQPDLIQKLLQLDEKLSTKIILFSRPTVLLLCHKMSQGSSLSIGRSTVKDIRLYLTRKLADLAEFGYLPQNTDLDTVSERLVSRAGGMFLWARLMISYLSSPALTLFQRSDCIADTNLPEGLDAMYLKIIQLILGGNQASKLLAKRIFTWLLHSRREISGNELEQILIFGTSTKSVCADTFQNFSETVLLTCAGLVERETGQVGKLDDTSPPFRFIHLSVQAYLLSSLEHDPLDSMGVNSLHAVRSLVQSDEQANAELATECLRYLVFRMSTQSLSWSNTKPIDQEHCLQNLPFYSYASMFWISHLLLSVRPVKQSVGISYWLAKPHDDLLDVIVVFLDQPLLLMSWIEVCYLLQSPPPANKLRDWVILVRDSMIQVVKDIDNTTLRTKKIEDFAHFLVQLQDLWGPQLSANPDCIWEEVAAFSPSQFLRQTTAIQVKSLVTESNPGAQSSSKYIKKVSQMTPDGVHITVLSIWPSRYGISVHRWFLDADK